MGIGESGKGIGYKYVDDSMTVEYDTGDKGGPWLRISFMLAAAGVIISAVSLVPYEKKRRA